METPDGPIFESNAIARYGKTDFPPPTQLINFGDPLKVVVLKLIFLSVVAVTRLKADNPLYGSSLIDYVRHLLLLIMLCVHECVIFLIVMHA